MISMIRKFFRTHHIKVVVGAPIIFVLVVTANVSGLIGTGNVFRINAMENGKFSAAGSQVRVSVEVHTKDIFNALGGVITFPANKLQVLSVERDTSVIDLWTQDPTHSNKDGTLSFSGGMLKPNVKDGIVFIINFKSLQEGRAFIAFEEAEILENDGKGTNIYTGSNILSISIRNKIFPSPDVNSDGELNFDDLMILYRKTFQSYDAKYDLDANGLVNWSDVKMLIAEF